MSVFQGQTAKNPNRVSGWLLKTKNMGPIDVFKTTWIQDKAAHLSNLFNQKFGLEHNKRWFVLDFSVRLLTYSNSPSSKKVTFIPFTSIRAVEKIFDPLKIGLARKGWLDGILIITKDRTYELWCSSPQERENWIAAFSDAITIGRKLVSDKSVRPLSRGYSLSAHQFAETPLNKNIMAN